MSKTHILSSDAVAFSDKRFVQSIMVGGSLPSSATFISIFEAANSSVTPDIRMRHSGAFNSIISFSEPVQFDGLTVTFDSSTGGGIAQIVEA